MTNDDLLLEIGSQAHDDLTSNEISSLTTNYTSSQKSMAGMKAFDLLRKKFRPTYRMGRTYKHLTDKYKFYDMLYKEYAATTDAGKVTSTSEDRSDRESLDRYKFTADGN